MERYLRSEVGFAERKNVGEHEASGNIAALPDGSFLFLANDFATEILAEVAAHLHVPNERIILYHAGKVIPSGEYVGPFKGGAVFVCHVHPSGNFVKVWLVLYVCRRNSPPADDDAVSGGCMVI